MRFLPGDLAQTQLDPQLLELLLDEHRFDALPRLQRFWDYYRNDLTDALADDHTASGRTYRLAQEQGLPRRLTHSGFTSIGGVSTGGREVVIENDIAWRIHAMVDFMFSKPVSLQSIASDPQRATLLEGFLRQVLEANGGMGFLHDLGLLGAVYGHVDVLLRVDEDALSKVGERTSLTTPTPDDLTRFVNHFGLEIIEAPRAVPVLHSDDYRQLDAYAIDFDQWRNSVEAPSLLRRATSRMLSGIAPATERARVRCTQVWTDEHVLLFQADGSFNTSSAAAATLVQQSINRLGCIPIVHIQNLPQPFFYEGLSEVEPLIALQDELNTRLSDRANRVTFQSFKMYLGKGIEGFTERAIGPGQMWATDNEHASIQEFGGDADSPSEESHIQQIRDALDKASGVTPIAAGLLRDRVGNLTSESALRIVLSGLLAKTQRKRLTYGAGIARVCELILHAADVFGVLPNDPSERRVRLDWPDPLPDNQADRLREAQIKLQLGVPRKQVLAELGYSEEQGAPAIVS